MSLINHDYPFIPEKIGPGVWYIIHSNAIISKTRQQKDEFIQMINHLSKTFPCEKCRVHFQEFLKAKPISKYYNTKVSETNEDIGMFYWSWRFHNNVNRRLNKKTLSFSDAYYLYNDISVSCESCKIKNNNFFQNVDLNDKKYQEIFNAIKK